jgi:hypothetical protein
MLQQFSAAADATTGGAAAGGMDAMDAAAAKKRSEEAAAQKRKFVPSTSAVVPASASVASGVLGEIDIDGDDLDAGGDGGAGAAQGVPAPKRRAVERGDDDFDTPSARAVPAAVFGGLVASE